MNLNIASAIHDIKNKLVSIAECSDNPGHEEISLIRMKAMEISSRLTTILEIYEIETNSVLINKIDVDASFFMQELLYDVQPFSKIKITFQSDCNDIVMLDPVLVKDAIVNAVQNANRYAKSIIILSGKIENDRMMIEVRDDGPGFSDERSSDNTGIGLEISKQIMKHHGSEIDLFNDHGAVFRLKV